MWDENPPAAVDALADMIVACASAVTAGLTSARMHYPAASITNDDTTTADPLPLCEIGEESAGRTPYCEPGVRGLPGGTLVATIYADMSTGELETLADSICEELNLSVTGLANVNASRVRASEPTPGQRAAADSTGATVPAITAISINVSYGLRA